MEFPGNIDISDFSYELPQDRIAQHPLEHRDGSRLLIFRDGKLSEDIFKNLGRHIASHSHMVFNETRVIPARLLVKKPTGATIELFCLEPAGLVRDYQLAMQQGPGCEWKCYVGNARRWKSDTLDTTLDSDHGTISLSATKIQKQDDHFLIRFEWTPEALSFSEILESFGKIPLPPYIRREADENDQRRYQTVYAREKGSVAAPTAGLHFTRKVLDELIGMGITLSTVNLHVGAGTFKPVTTEKLSGHQMHTEFVSVSADFLEKLVREAKRPTILVGTTTIRTIESLYWQGLRWMKSPPADTELQVGQWEPYTYQEKEQAPAKEAFEALLYYLRELGQSHISGYTSLLIAPGYRYKVPDAVITNFHMPQSTLLLLIAAYIGEAWKEAYRYALDHGFRFLSYGDSCLFFKH